MPPPWPPALGDTWDSALSPGTGNAGLKRHDHPSVKRVRWLKLWTWHLPLRFLTREELGSEFVSRQDRPSPTIQSQSTGPGRSARRSTGRSAPAESHPSRSGGSLWRISASPHSCRKATSAGMVTAVIIGRIVRTWPPAAEPKGDALGPGSRLSADRTGLLCWTPLIPVPPAFGMIPV